MKFYILLDKDLPIFLEDPKFNPRLLKLDALTLKSYYHSKGFLNVEIKDSYENEKNSIDIKYDITEGKKAATYQKLLEGNNLIKVHKIKKF